MFLFIVCPSSVKAARVHVYLFTALFPTLSIVACYMSSLNKYLLYEKMAKDKNKYLLNTSPTSGFCRVYLIFFSQGSYMVHYCPILLMRKLRPKKECDLP
jgi:hypothetical protein